MVMGFLLSIKNGDKYKILPIITAIRGVFGLLMVTFIKTAKMVDP